jgi:hypothetical protein
VFLPILRVGEEHPPIPIGDSCESEFLAAPVQREAQAVLVIEFASLMSITGISGTLPANSDFIATPYFD